MSQIIRRNGKSIDLKKINEEAIKLCPIIRVTFVIDRTVDVCETTSTVINLRRVKYLRALYQILPYYNRNAEFHLQGNTSIRDNLQC
jgi:hypothetical protein